MESRSDMQAVDVLRQVSAIIAEREINYGEFDITAFRTAALEHPVADEAARILLEAWPAQVATPIAAEIHNVLTTARGGVLTIGCALAIYFSSSGVESVRIGLNRAYGVVEPHSWWLMRLESIVYVLVGGVALLYSDTFALTRAGMWSALTRKRHTLAVVGALRIVMLWPWLALNHPIKKWAATAAARARVARRRTPRRVPSGCSWRRIDRTSAAQGNWMNTSHRRLRARPSAVDWSIPGSGSESPLPIRVIEPRGRRRLSSSAAASASARCSLSV